MEYNIGLKEDAFSRRELEGAAQVSAWLADLLWRWRFPLSAIIVLVALAFAPRANITHIDNDITAWFAKDDPVYRDYERFRDEFGGSRTLIIALKADSADRLFSQPTLDFIRQATGDIERVDTVERVASLATATTVDAMPRSGGSGRSADAPADGGIDVRRLIEAGGSQTPDDVRRRAMKDDLIRGDLVSDSGAVTAIVVSFDEERIDKVRGGVIQRIHDLVDPKLPPGVKAYYNGSLEISETYNRITLANQRTFTPPIFVITLLAVYLAFRSWRKMVLTIVAVGISVLWTLGLFSLMGYSYNVLSSMLIPLIVVLAIADDVHIMQHWDEERRHKSAEAAFKATVAHLAAPLLGASATTALGHAVARHEQRRRRPVVRRRVGGRDHGRLHDLARVRAHGAEPDEAGAPGAGHEKYLVEPDAADRGVLDAASPRVLAVTRGDRARGGVRDPGSARRHQPHQLLQRQSPARAVGARDRRRAVGDLQLPDPAGGTAGIAEHAREPSAHGPARERAAEAARTSRRCGRLPTTCGG